MDLGIKRLKSCLVDLDGELTLSGQETIRKVCKLKKMMKDISDERRKSQSVGTSMAGMAEIVDIREQCEFVNRMVNHT